MEPAGDGVASLKIPHERLPPPSRHLTTNGNEVIEPLVLHGVEDGLGNDLLRVEEFQEHRAPSPRQSHALGSLMVGQFFVMFDWFAEMEYVSYVFPCRIFGDASFFLKQKILDHEKSRWHARRMPRRTPKPWGTLAPSSLGYLHTMSDMPICWGPMSSDATSTKRGLTVYLIK
jgi:hypothetical protein